MTTPDTFQHHYHRKMHSAPLLTQDEEYTLAKKWRDSGDKKAVDTLVKSHLRLVNKIAQGYKGYGLPLSDLVAEGHVGIMQAMKNFDPDRGFRFSTYAMWWIRASMQEYVLNMWSLVKVGTTASQKKLFFNLRKLKKELGVTHLSCAQKEDIAQKLDVRASDVHHMEERMRGGDSSLNAPVKESSGEALEWIDWVHDDNSNHETQILQRDDIEKKRALFQDALNALSAREQAIFRKRRMEEPPLTLDVLSLKHNISKERVRQIEMSALQKLKKAVRFALFDKKF